MTTLNEPATALPAATVFGVDWPLHKLHALVVAVLVVPLVLALGGSGSLAAWLAGAAMVVVWWGERSLAARRCDHRSRERDIRY